MQKYIHFIQSAFISVDTQPFASKGIPQHQQTTINNILLYIRENKISTTQEKYLAYLAVARVRCRYAFDSHFDRAPC